MKTVSILSCIVVLSIAPSVSPAQPNMVVEGGTTFSLDTLMAGQVAEKIIKLRNAGSDVLNIEKVDVSCGCTGTMVSNDRIKPGEAGDLRITFDSKNFSGQVHKSVTLTTNDPKKNKERVDFTAFVVQEVSVSESRLVFKDAVVGEPKAVTITLTNNGREALELKGYDTTLKGLVLKHPSSVAPGKSVELTAEYTPEKPQRVLSSNISLHTSNSNKPEILFYVFGSVKDWKFE